jgi:hypothetical protein
LKTGLFSELALSGNQSRFAIDIAKASRRLPHATHHWVAILLNEHHVAVLVERDHRNCPWVPHYIALNQTPATQNDIIGNHVPHVTGKTDL